MTRVSTTALAASLVAALAAGCGGGASSTGQGGGNRPTGGAGLNGVSLANCLIDENWLVAPSEGLVEGVSESGIRIEIRIFPTPDAAKKAAGSAKNKKQVARVVVTYLEARTGSNTGGRASKASSAETKTIKMCVDQLEAA